MTIPLWHPYKWYQIGYYALHVYMPCIWRQISSHPQGTSPQRQRATRVPSTATRGHIWPPAAHITTLYVYSTYRIHAAGTSIIILYWHPVHMYELCQYIYIYSIQSDTHANNPYFQESTLYFMYASIHVDILTSVIPTCSCQHCMHSAYC